MRSNPNIITRTAYTFFSSLIKIDDIISNAKKNDYSYAFYVDKNIMYGAMEFYEKCIKNNIKPIIGLTIMTGDVNETYIAKNYKGYLELVKVSSFIQLDKALPQFKKENLIKIRKDVKVSLVLNKEDFETLKMFNSLSNNVLDTNWTYLDNKEANEEILKLSEQINKESNFTLKSDKDILPSYRNEKGEKSGGEKYLKSLLFENFQKFLKTNPKVDKEVYLKRLEFELNVIIEMKFENYFLIVWDIIKWAKNNNIFVGPGRGSAGGSFISFLLGITAMDPIANDLLFERFLNPDRISMPDIDVDFEDLERDKVIKYITEKYGLDNVAQIITFQTLKSRSALKDWSRIMEISPQRANEISKLIPLRANTLKEAFKSSKQFRLEIESSEIISKIYESASLIEGLPRQFSTHAAGIVISDEKILNSVPIQKGGSNTFLTQYSMNYMEMNGLLKIDVLGLRNLSFIKSIIKKIDDPIILENIPFNDDKAFEVLRNGYTAGIFQLESPGMTKILKKMKVSTFEDIVSTTSLFRPGPNKQIDEFISRKNGNNKINYYVDAFEPILKNTYGIIVYQEQIMQIVQVFSGFSIAKADILRRAISKKEDKILNTLKSDFFSGAKANGHSDKLIAQIYELVHEFTKYGFNRSHAFAYSILSYQLAWLKAYYPLQFLSSLLNSVVGDLEKTRKYIIEAKRMNVKIIPPNFENPSNETLIKGKAIVLPINVIKGVGGSIVKKILEHYSLKGNAITSFLEYVIFMDSLGVGLKHIEVFIEAGTIDYINEDRGLLLSNLDKFMSYINLIKVSDNDTPKYNISLFTPPALEKNNESTKEIFNHLEKEIELYGFSFNEVKTSAQDNKVLNDLIKKNNATPLDDLALTPNSRYKIVGTILDLKEVTTKNNQLMCFLNVTDGSVTKKLVLWPGTYTKYKNDINYKDYFIFNINVSAGKWASFIVQGITKT